MIQPTLNSRYVYSLIIVSVLLFTAVIYFPGLHSRFLLDDFYNLIALETVDGRGYLYYILNGGAGRSGRPVSLITFALQSQDWPANPFAFKLFNLLIHLVNGLLIFFITGRLGKILNLNEADSKKLAFVVITLWLLNPIHISTVLYVVQRMTQLSAMFTLLGILGYLYLRDRYIQKNSNTIVAVMICCLLACMILAVFSKENGILLPLYILIIEWVFFAKKPVPGIWNFASRTILISPLIFLCIYLTFNFESALSSYQGRNFTMGERLLTEPRILLEYIQKIVLPHPSLFSLYQDDYAKSVGLLEPPATIISIIAILALILAAIKLRAWQPVISFGILWFLGGHLLESTYLNLELYYEHRNYLPSMGIIFIIAWAIIGLWGKINNKKLVAVPILLYLTLIIAVTTAESMLWANPIEQIGQWQNRHPTSSRAIDDLGNAYVMKGDYKKAIEIHYKILEVNKNDFYPYLKEISIKGCVEEMDLDNKQWEKVIAMAEIAKWSGLSVISILDSISNRLDQGKCKSINIYNLLTVVVKLAFNPEFKDVRHFLHQIAAVLNVNLGAADAALENINRALELRESSNSHGYKIRILMGLERYPEAAKALEDYKTYSNTSLKTALANKNTIQSLEAMLSNKRE